MAVCAKLAASLPPLQTPACKESASALPSELILHSDAHYVDAASSSACLVPFHVLPLLCLLL